MTKTAYIALKTPPGRPASGFDDACYRDLSALDGAELLALDGSPVDLWSIIKVFAPNPALIINPLCWKYAKALTKLNNLSLEKFDEVFLSTSFLCYVLPSRLNSRVVVRHHNCEWKYMSALAAAEPNLFRRAILVWTSCINRRLLASIIARRPYTHVFYTNQDFVETRSGLHHGLNPSRFRVLPLKYQKQVSKKLVCIDSVVFFGGGHGPNIEAARWIIDEVAPHVPWCTVRIYVPGLSQNSSSNVQIKNWIDDPFTLNNGKTLYLLPAFSGSGVKIKILDALEHGAPLAANYSALEGLPSEIECLLPDDKVEAASATIKFLRSRRYE